jgi:thiamine biosynthesis lipoprotein
MRQLAKSSKKPKAKQSFSFEAIGTQWSIGIYEVLEASILTELKLAIVNRIEQFDIAYSRFRPDSLVSKIAKKAGRYELPADSKKLMAFYDRLYKVSHGAVTPLIGRALADAGYDADYSLSPQLIKPVPRWEDVMDYNHGILTTNQPILLDFGAAGKGYLVEIIADILENFNIPAYYVDASGDMIYRHPTQTLSIGLEHPDDPTLAIGVIELSNQSICGSASNRRRWHDFHHILDPHTLRPVENIKAVWTLADDTMLADGLATALFFVPASSLEPNFDFEYVCLYTDNSVETSDNLNGYLFEA